MYVGSFFFKFDSKHAFTINGDSNKFVGKKKTISEPIKF